MTIKETDFTTALMKHIGPSPAGRLIAEGLFRGTPLQELAKAGLLWGWELYRKPAPDGLVSVIAADARKHGVTPPGYTTAELDAAANLNLELAVGAIEAKAPHTVVQWTLLKSYARQKNADPTDPTRSIFTDPVSSRVYADVVGGSLPHLYPKHEDHDCASDPCKSPKYFRGLHAPSLHQGDVYASSVKYVPNDLTHHGVDLNPRRLTLIFLSPNDKSSQAWQDSLLSAEVWHTVKLPEAIKNWRAVQDRDRRVEGFADYAEEFLHPTT